MSISVDIDDDRYEAIAKSFVVAFLSRLINQLSDKGVISISDTCSVEAADDDKIFEFGFVLLAAFEDFKGFEHDGQTYFANCLFSADPPRSIPPGTLIGSFARTSLHGNVEDEAIQRALVKVCAGKVGGEASPKRIKRQ